MLLKLVYNLLKMWGIHNLILEGGSLIIYRGLAGISPSPTSVMGLGQLVMSSAVLFFLCT